MSTHDTLARYRGRALFGAALLMLLAALLQLVALPAAVLLISAERATAGLDSVLTAAATAGRYTPQPDNVRAVRAQRIE
jgi:hypothetical protein